MTKNSESWTPELRISIGEISLELKGGCEDDSVQSLVRQMFNLLEDKKMMWLRNLLEEVGTHPSIALTKKDVHG